MGRLERASEGSLGGLKEGESLAWRDRIEKVRDVPGLLQVRPPAYLAVVVFMGCMG